MKEERARAAAEKESKRKAQAAKEQSDAYCQVVHKTIKEAFIALGCNPDLATKLLNAAKDDAIPFISIRY